MGRAGLLRRGRRRDVRGGRDEHAGSLAGALRRGAPGPDLPQLPRVPGPGQRAPGARARGPETASRHGGGACARHRRPRPDHRSRIGRRRKPHPAGGGVRCSARRGRGHEPERNRRAQDRLAPARHRQACRARAHPHQARAPDAHGIRLHPAPSHGRRGHHPRRAVSVSGRALHSEPSRALGRHRLPGRLEGRGHPARRAGSRGRRLLRRDHGAPSLPSGDGARRGHRHHQAGGRQGAGPAPGRALHRRLGAGRNARGHGSDDVAPRARTGANGRALHRLLHRRQLGRSRRHGLPEHFPGHARGTGALRHRADAGHATQRRRHDGPAHLEDEPPGPGVVLGVVPAGQPARHRPLPVCLRALGRHARRPHAFPRARA